MSTRRGDLKARTSRTAIDISVAVVLAGLLVYAYWGSRHAFFFVDDWAVLHQSRHPGGFLQDYNGHLGIVHLAIYRALAEVFGFWYAPFQVAGLASLFAFPGAYYLAHRRVLTPALAAVLCLAVFATDQAWLGPAELMLPLALAAGVGCSAALDRGRTADGWLAAGLAVALATSGVGVAVAAGCIVHVACVGAPRRRWAAVVAPAVAWLGWWLVVGRHNGSEVPAPISEGPGQAWRIVVAAFEALGFHNPVLGGLLLVGHLALGLSLLRKGREAAANWLAWTAGLAAWTLGLATSRGVLANADVSRYQLIAVGFILLSVVPRSRPAWATRLEQPTRAPALAVLCALVLLAGAARIPSLARDSSFAQVMDNSAPLDRGRLVVVDVGPEALPDDTELPVTMGFLSAGEVRGLLDRYGHPFSSTEPDAELVEVGAVEVSVAPGRRPTDCSPIDAPLFVESATAVDPLVLWSPDGPVDVALRRFGDAWVPLTTTTPGSVVRLRLPKLESQVPWQIRAFGACR